MINVLCYPGRGRMCSDNRELCEMCAGFKHLENGMLTDEQFQMHHSHRHHNSLPIKMNYRIHSK